MFPKRILALPLLFIAAANYAHSMDVYLSVGPNFSRLSNNTSVQINEFVINDYRTDEKTKVSPLASLGLGHTFKNVFHDSFDIALSMGAIYVDYVDQIEGTESPFINSGDYDTLNYQFSAQSFAVMWDTRFIYNKYAWRPFVLLGIGVSWNKLYDYSESPTNTSNSAAPVPSDFTAHTQASFAYEAGLGLQHTLFFDKKNDIQWLASFEYRYINAGDAELGRSAAQTVNDRLTVDNLYAQALLFTLQAVF